jgi:cold shock CspA family protein
MGETTGTPTSKSNWNIGALSNSSSSVPGPGCIGLGRIESLDERTGAGRIRGEDGTTFRFFQAGVVDEGTLQCGQAVEFIDSDGVATRIRSKIGAGSSLIGGVANSSSPIAHPAREMTGRVLDFDQRTGRGRIRGADDSSYSFYPAGAIGGSTLIAGQGVVFQESDGIATRIRAVGSTAEPSRTIGAVSNSSSSQPSPGQPRRGAVQGFDSRTGMGKIIDEDQNTYRFFPAGVTDGATLKPGSKVSFVDKDGVAVDIQKDHGSFWRMLLGKFC